MDILSLYSLDKIRFTFCFITFNMEETSDTSKMNEDIAVTTKRKQSDIASFFGGSAKKKIPKQSTTQASKAGPATRTLQTTTALKWKSTSLAKYNADEWLLVNENKIDTGLVESLKCATCTKFRDRIMSMKGFTTQWSDCGSTRLQHTAAVEHATSEPHIFRLVYETEGSQCHRKKRGS